MKTAIEDNNRIFPGCRQMAWAVSSGVLLALSYPKINWNILAWVCFVPLLIALRSVSSGRQAYFLGLLTGISGISIGFYWVGHWATSAMAVPFPLNILFVIGFAFCFGQVFGLIGFFFVWISRQTKLDEIVIFPVLFVTIFSIFPMLFSFRLGDSQWQFLTAIQLIDITGIAGLDFILILSNVLIYKLCSGSWHTGNRFVFGLALIAISGWFLLGWIRLQTWDQEIAGWQTKKVGIVQPNREVTFSRPAPIPGFSREYPLEMQLSEELVSEGVDIVVWPEGHFFGYAFWENVSNSFHQTIARWRVPLVFYDATRRLIDQKKRAFNTILFLNEAGELVEMYDKIKLVPFSEYLPFISNSLLFDWILGDYLDNLTPGTESKTIQIAGMRIVPRVCYEPLFPEFVADSIGSDAAGKVILVQSQDGWFGETSQPFQHMAVTVMRAVENRVPLIHVIQNGPSGVIHPNGRFAFLSKSFVKGSWVAELSYNPSKGGSFYSRSPNLFINVNRLISVLLILGSFYKRKTM